MSWELFAVKVKRQQAAGLYPPEVISVLVFMHMWVGVYMCLKILVCQVVSVLVCFDPYLYANN